MSDSVYLPFRPSCNLCSQPAEYDARTRYSWWAYLCENCWQQIGVGRLGTGYGQRIVTDPKLAQKLKLPDPWTDLGYLT